MVAKERVSQRLLIAGFAFPDDRLAISVAGIDMGVETVKRDVGLAAAKPLDVVAVLFEDRIVGLEPVQILFVNPVPETLEVGCRFIVQLLVLLFGSDNRFATELIAGRKYTVVLYDAIDLTGVVFAHGRAPRMILVILQKAILANLASLRTITGSFHRPDWSRQTLA